GHGRVWLQSLPFSRLADRILRMAPSAGGKAQGEGSVLGGIGRMIDGDNF
ncbi:MAG: TIGR00266 family protein, partial [Verrucomicrobiota bacterium]